MKNAHTSVTDRIPKPLGPKPSSIFNDKSWFLSCHNKIQKNIINNQKLFIAIVIHQTNQISIIGSMVTKIDFE